MFGSQMQLEDWLDDLCVRFIINLPQEDLSSVARICFQVEEAQWFYEDFIRPLDPNLPSMSLRTFCLRMFQHCPLLANFSVENHTKAFEEFLQYKTRVPVRGAILLNEAMDSTVLVKGWKKGANWSFPRGKINKDEDDLDCAVREVYEETGLDLQATGLVPTDTKPKYIEISMREQQLRLYVFRNVPMDTNFQPRTRKEISKIEWYKLSDLPAFRKKGLPNDAAVGAHNANKFYMVAPFLVPLKKWVVSQKKLEAKKNTPGPQPSVSLYMPIDEVPTEDDAWGHTDIGTDPTPRAPAIGTLEGATQELQRLLKVQPPTQGIQSHVSPQDKGSALLSLLQTKDPAPATTSQYSGQVPHTPLDLTIGKAPEPPAPHNLQRQHQMQSTNAQQPPPSFALPPHPDAASWNSPNMQGGKTQSFSQHLPPSTHPGHYGKNQANMAHPQPLPPQVQRAVFNRSAFQDGPQRGQQGGQAPHMGHNPQSHYAQHIPTAPQGPMYGENMRPVQQLNGQSMALLNAFKSSGANSQMKENAGYAQEMPAVSSPQPSRHYGPAGASPAQQQAHQQGYSVPPGTSQSPKELQGSRVGPPEGHRSALLGMFRKSEPQSAGDRPQSGQSQRGGHASGGSAHLDLLAQLQGRSSGANFHVAGSQQAANTGLPLQHLSMQSDTPSTQQQQPMRILQRGQADPSAAPGQTRASPHMSPHTQLMYGQFMSPSSIAAMPASIQRPQSGPDQKRQLLSLFGKQQSSPSPMSMEADRGKEVISEMHKSRVASLAQSGGVEMGPSSTSSSRRGSQTPISPAERTFLLGYLESVTNKASR